MWRIVRGICLQYLPSTDGDDDVYVHVCPWPDGLGMDTPTIFNRWFTFLRFYVLLFLYLTV